MYMNLKSVTYMRSKSRVSFRDVGTIINSLKKYSSANLKIISQIENIVINEFGI